MEKIELKTGERLEYLDIYDMEIIQNGDLYTFTSDAIVLANSVKSTSRDNILDIGSGSGIIPLIIAGKNKFNHIDGIEIQDVMADMARRSVQHNCLSHKINIINEDIKNYNPDIQYDIIVSNPPYFAGGERREREEVAISRHEIKLTLEELICRVAKLLKYGGKFYMVHKCSRLAEVITLMTNAKIIPKVLTLIYPKANIPADTFIIEGKSHAKHGLRMNKFIMYNDDGSMTEDALKMYNKEKK